MRFWELRNLKTETNAKWKYFIVNYYTFCKFCKVRTACNFSIKQYVSQYKSKYIARSTCKYRQQFYQFSIDFQQLSVYLFNFFDCGNGSMYLAFERYVVRTPAMHNFFDPLFRRRRKANELSPQIVSLDFRLMQNKFVFPSKKWSLVSQIFFILLDDLLPYFW